MAIFLCSFSLEQGCARREVSSEWVGRDQAVEESAVGKSPFSESEAKQIATLKEYLDGDDARQALFLARSMMETTNEAVKIELSTAFGWIGKPAIPELCELLKTDNQTLRILALHAWETSVGEILDDDVKIAAITNSIAKFDDREVIDTMLSQMSGCEERTITMALSNYISRHEFTVSGIVAKEYYEHVSGEEWQVTGIK